MKQAKTNVMRILEKNQVSYEPIYYDLGEIEFSGVAVAALTGIPEEQTFKTLTGKGVKQDYAVFLIPVARELNLKKAALAANDKRIELVNVKELLFVTGYNRGEVSPLGMKKQFPTYIDASAMQFDKIVISAGKKGASVMVDPKALDKLLQVDFIDLTTETE